MQHNERSLPLVPRVIAPPAFSLYVPYDDSVYRQNEQRSMKIRWLPWQRMRGSLPLVPGAITPPVFSLAGAAAAVSAYKLV
jgi:hypothetical protein